MLQLRHGFTDWPIKRLLAVLSFAFYFVLYSIRIVLYSRANLAKRKYFLKQDEHKFRKKTRKFFNTGF